MLTAEVIVSNEVKNKYKWLVDMGLEGSSLGMFEVTMISAGFVKTPKLFDLRKTVFSCSELHQF
jgi:hypothetical protein